MENHDKLGQAYAEDEEEAKSLSKKIKMSFCKQKRHKVDGTRELATHICYEDKLAICGECAQDLETYYQKTCLSSSFISNKCRVVLTIIQKELNLPLAANKNN